MRRIFLIVVAVAILLGSSVSGTGSVMAADDLPRTFSGCVISGGQVRMAGDEISCREIRAYDFRVYGTGTTECGEEIELEVWGETHDGVVTYFLAPGKTVDLPEIGEDAMTLPDAPIPCLED